MLIACGEKIGRQQMTDHVDSPAHSKLHCRKCGIAIDCTDCGLPICRDCKLTEAEQREHDALLEYADEVRRRGWCKEEA